MPRNIGAQSLLCLPRGIGARLRRVRMRVEHDEAVGDLHGDVVAAGGVGHHFLDATFQELL